MPHSNVGLESQDDVDFGLNSSFASIIQQNKRHTTRRVDLTVCPLQLIQKVGQPFNISLGDEDKLAPIECPP